MLALSAPDVEFLLRVVHVFAATAPPGCDVVFYGREAGAGEVLFFGPALFAPVVWVGGHGGCVLRGCGLMGWMVVEGFDGGGWVWIQCRGFCAGKRYSEDGGWKKLEDCEICYTLSMVARVIVRGVNGHCDVSLFALSSASQGHEYPDKVAGRSARLTVVLLLMYYSSKFSAMPS